MLCDTEPLRSCRQARTVIKVMHVSAEDAPVLSLRGETKGIVASLSRKGTGERTLIWR